MQAFDSQIADLKGHIKFLTELKENTKRYVKEHPSDEISNMLEFQKKTLKKLHSKLQKVEAEALGNVVQKHTITVVCDGRNTITIEDVYDNICDVPEIGKSRFIKVMYIDDKIIVDPKIDGYNDILILRNKTVLVLGSNYVMSFKNGRLAVN